MDIEDVKSYIWITEVSELFRISRGAFPKAQGKSWCSDPVNS